MMQNRKTGFLNFFKIKNKIKNHLEKDDFNGLINSFFLT